MLDPNASAPSGMLERADTCDPIAFGMAYRMLVLLEGGAEDKADSVERALTTLWICVDAAINEDRLVRAQSVALIVLRKFFSHRASWKKMRECMRARMEFAGLGPQDMEQLDPEHDEQFWKRVQECPIDLCASMRAAMAQP